MEAVRTMVVAALLLGTGLFTAALAADPYFVYASGDIPGGGDGKNIRCFHFDPTAATAATMLTAATASAGGTGPGYLAWSADRTHLFAINSAIPELPNGGGGVVSFSIDPATGGLTRINAVRSGPSTGVGKATGGTVHLCVHPRGTGAPATGAASDIVTWIFVAHYNTEGDVSVIEVQRDGTLKDPRWLAQAGKNAHMVVMNAAGTRLYVPCLGGPGPAMVDNHIAIFDFDAVNGLSHKRIVAMPSQVSGNPAGPRHLAFDHDETHAYVINEVENTMATFTHDPASGNLTWVASVPTLPSGYVGTSKGAHVVVANNGRTLYGSNRRISGATSSIVSFALGIAGEVLVPALAHDTAGGEIEHPRDFTIDPTGTTLLVASRGDDGTTATKWLNLFRVNPSGGALTSLGKVTVPLRPDFVGVMSKAPVANVAPTVRTAASAAPSPVVAGSTTTSLSVLGSDDLPENTLTYTWSTTGVLPAAVAFGANGTNATKACTVTFAKAGRYDFRVTIRDLDALSTTSDVTVQVDQTATTVTVAPTPASVTVHGVQQFSASAKDQFGVAMAVAPTFAWSTTGGGTISASGLFTAGATAGSGFLIKADVAGKYGLASLTVTADTPPTVATAASATPNPVTGTTTALSVLGADNGGQPALTYSWSATGSPPAMVAFSASGTNAAKAATATFTRAGSYTLRATITDASNLTVTSDVVVVVAQTPTSLRLDPPSASLAVGTDLAFTAIRRDQFGVDIATAVTPTWAVTAGAGSVSPAGVFTAPTAAGASTLTATVSGVPAATAAITTVVPGTPPPASGGGGGGGGCGLGAGLGALLLALLSTLRLGRSPRAITQPSSSCR